MPTYSTKEAADLWRQKTNHVRLRGVLSKTVPLAHINVAQSIARNERLGGKVAGVLNRYGVIQDMRLPYHAYARAMDKVQRVFPWMVDRVREHTILRARAEGQGLDPNVLDELDKFVIYNAMLGP